MAGASASGTRPSRASARAKAASIRSMAAMRARSLNTARIASVAKSGPRSTESRGEKVMRGEPDSFPFHWQTDVVLGKGGGGGARARHVIEFGELPAAVERARLVEAVQEGGHPPGKALRLPDTAKA